MAQCRNAFGTLFPYFRPIRVALARQFQRSEPPENQVGFTVESNEWTLGRVSRIDSAGNWNWWPVSVTLLLLQHPRRLPERDGNN